MGWWAELGYPNYAHHRDRPFLFPPTPLFFHAAAASTCASSSFRRRLRFPLVPPPVTPCRPNRMDATTDLSRSRRRRRPAKSASPPPDTANENPEYDLGEPTMAEKLAALNLPAEDGQTVSGAAAASAEEEQSTAVVPPSADSVHVLLKQALRADDRAALLDCLSNRDDKVIAKSISLLTPADAVKLLKSLILLMQSRGLVLVCMLPWLQTLLGRHMSSIVSQESSLLLLNSLYQLIDARTSTFASLLKMSTCLDYHFSEIGDDESDEEEGAPLIIYEDKDSDEEESEVDDDAMETEEKETDEDESEVDDM